MDVFDQENHELAGELQRAMEIIYEPEMWPVVRSYPPVLARACCILQIYAVGLRTGEIIWFRGANPINRAWVHLPETFEKNPECRRPDGRAFQCEQGMDVRIRDITWVAESPGMETETYQIKQCRCSSAGQERSGSRSSVQGETVLEFSRESEMTPIERLKRKYGP
ncbi:hypothetical protein HNR65_002244 [Desulfosalsimonas propionicica]|uniref:Uncharacterized protein n=1 Tax=Desulfosalsimonas propionicica TaxID=332175 RepID=A0A7W0CA04_9BACT|nr:hypothetical protein [Desulfosalsimonas propionicica]MBA2881910.1 hypothetical protein [Desulfosalsimonas propionicica]